MEKADLHLITGFNWLFFSAKALSNRLCFGDAK
jgi:hypothetical protein